MKNTPGVGGLSAQRWSRVAWKAVAVMMLATACGANAQTSYGISTLASGAANFSTPEGVTVDSAGNVYVADTGGSRVRKVTSAGVVSTLAATGFNGPAGVAVDTAGNVFVADTLNHVIKKVDSGGTVTVVAGSSGSSGASVASATLAAARFNSPQGIAVTGSGATAVLYVADTGNQVVRKIDITGDAVTTIAGTQGLTGADATHFNFPSAVALSGTLLYVADRENHAIRKIDLGAGNAVTTFAGTLGTSGSTNSPALFFRPRGIAVDGSGNVYVADYSNQTIRQITSGGTVSTVAGTAGSTGATDGIGAAARFNGPWGIAVDGSGNIYVGDSNNNAIRKGSPASAPTLFSTQPSPATFTIGATTSVTFTVAANGSPAPTYRWQRAAASDPTTFANLSDGTANGLTVSGTTTATLTISGAAVANNGDQFRAVATNDVGSLSSSGATLTVNQQPTITSASSANFVVNSLGSFTVTATGSPAPTFDVTSGTFPADWANYASFQSTGVISGTPPNTVGSPFTFTIRASNGVGTAATQSFTLTVTTTVPPAISVQPANYTVPAGSTTATFSVSATGNPAVSSYQWERQAGGIGSFVAVATGTPAGVTYTGATSSTLSISGVNSTMNGDVFRVVVGNGATTTSSSATLFVPPVFSSTASTNFVINQDNTFIIRASGAPSPTITQTGGTLPNGVIFTAGAGTATLSGTPTEQGTYFLSFSATNSGGTATQSFTLSVQQPQAPVITSASSATFTVNQPGTFTFTASGAPAADFTLAGGSSLPPGLTFVSPVLSGTPTNADNSPLTFSVVATNTAGTSPTQTFTLTILGSPPVITADPVSATANVGGSATFSASASGTPQPTIRWQRQPGGTTGFVNLTESGTYVGTQSTTLTVNNIDASMSGDQFRIVATNNNSVTATSLAATLTVNIGTAFTTIAGLPQFSGFIDGLGSAARFNSPTSIAVDFSGNLYIADTANHVIRKMTPSGVVTTIAGQAGISGTADGVGSAARFNSPQGVAVDSIGNVYVADTFNHTIRVVSAGGTVSTLAGSPGVGGSVNALGSSARFLLPSGIVVDGSGTIYVADTSNHAIRRVLSNGDVSTFAGTLGVAGWADNSVGTSARFNLPVGLARDSSGNIYVADSLNHVIRKITAAGEVSTVAGAVGIAGTADGNATTARFNRPSGVAVDNTGNIYVADTLSSTLRKINSSVETTTVAGLAGNIGTTDGVGGQVRFNQPVGVAVDFSGNIYVADTRNHTIRRTGAAAAPTITTQPSAKTAPPGGSVTFTVAATGAPAPGYQWQRQPVSSPGVFSNLVNDVTFSGVNTASLTITGVTSEMNGDQFRVIANNGVGLVATSDAATLTVGTAPVFTSAAAATFRAGESNTHTVTVTSDPAATFSLSGNPSWLTIDASTGVISGTPPDTSGSPLSITVTANNGVSATQTLTVTILPAQVAPVITTQPVGGVLNQGDLASFSVVATGIPAPTYQWRRNGIDIPGATNPTLVLPNVQPSSAGTYTVAVANVVTTVLSNAATLAVNTAPMFVVQPHAQVAIAGSPVTFTSSATGGNVSYQWRKNGIAIPGAISETYTLSSVSAADAGNYDVLISSPLGAAASSLAQLTIVTGPTAPVITAQPAARTALVGSSVTLVAAASGAPAPSYQWRKNGANLAGQTNATLTLAPVQVNDAANYDVVISNASGTVTSNPAGLRVITRSYAGIYFGSSASLNVSFAFYVREDNTGVFVGYLPSPSTALVNANIVVNDGGQFAFLQSGVTVNVSIGTDGGVTGSLGGTVSTSLAGTRSADAGTGQRYAGFYQAGSASSGTIIYTIANANNLAMVVAQAGGAADGGTGTAGTVVNNLAQITVSTGRTTITETIDVGTGTISGTASGLVNASVSGGSDAALARQRLLNISSRARVASADSVAIAGFVISGEESKPVLIRAVGPTLASFGVSGTLASPRLELFRSTATGSVSIGVNTGIAGNRTAIDAAGQQAGAFALGASGADAAILTTLAPGNYTAQVTGSNNTAGVALIEVYDLSAPVPGQKMLNISTRAAAGTAENTLTAGFVVPPGAAKRVLIRGIGPGLAPFGVTGVLTQPVLTLLNGSTTVATNTGYATSADRADLVTASTQVGGFPMANADSALLVTLPPGNYTAQVVGVNNGTGVALIEVYEVP